MATSLPTNVTAGTPDLPGMLNESHAALNELSRDTGWCDATSFLRNGWTANAVHIRRTSEAAYLVIRGLDKSAATSNSFLLLAGTAPGVHPRMLGGAGNMRSSRFPVEGGDFYFSISANNLYGYFSGSATSMGIWDVRVTLPAIDTAWPPFTPPAVA